MKLLLISFEIIPKIPLFIVTHEYFENSLFLSNVIECNKLDNNIHVSQMTSAFKKQILKNPKSTFNVLNPHRVKLLTRLKVGLSICVNVNFDRILKTP